MTSMNIYNNNQAFYSQVSWDRLEIKSYRQKKGIKQERKRRGKIKGDKKLNKKEKRQQNAKLKKAKKWWGKNLT
jgi:hypothetical protein